MSITFQASVDYSTMPKVKVFLVDLYPGLDEECFASDVGYGVYFDEESKRHYQMDYAEPGFVYEVNMSNANFDHVLKIIDHNLWVLHREEPCHSIKHADLPAFRRKIIKVINKDLSFHEVESFQHGNFFSGGIDSEYITKRMIQMLEIIDNAQKRELDVFWA